MSISMVAVLLMLVFSGLILTLFVRYFFLKKQYTPAIFPPEPWAFLPNISGSTDRKKKASPCDEARDNDAFARRLARLIQIPTVSWTDRSRRDTAMFDKFQEVLTELFPLVHQKMERRVLGHFGLIYHWKSEQKKHNPEKKPVLFLAHYDVVPAQEAGEGHEEPAEHSAPVDSHSAEEKH